MIPRYTENK
jgi:Prp8 binding protein